MSDPILTIFAWSFIVYAWLLILVPYLCGRSDLLTSWNFFLAGSSLFVGCAAINSCYSTPLIPYAKMDYIRYCIGGVVFYLTITITYYKFKLPRKLSKKIFQKWPSAKPAVLFSILPIVAIFIVGMIVSRFVYTPVVTQMMHYLGLFALALSVSLAFAAWYKQIINPALFFTFLAILIVATILTASFSFGRRPFLSILLSFPIIAYWLRWRYRKPIVVLLLGSLVGFAIFTTIISYSDMRTRLYGKWGNIPVVAREVRDMFFGIVNPNWDSAKKILAQDTAECSLLAIHLYTHEKTAKPFHSLFWTITNPIPRTFWKNKPVSLGVTLPHDGKIFYGIRHVYIGKTNNWGPGIIGHGYQDGGVIALIVYAILFGSFLRIVDELLMSQPDNPYLLAGFVAFSGQIIAWSRGDIGGFTIQIVATITVTWFVCRIGRLLYGTKMIYNRPKKQQTMVIKRTTLPSKPTQ